MSNPPSLHEEPKNSVEDANSASMQMTIKDQHVEDILNLNHNFALSFIQPPSARNSGGGGDPLEVTINNNSFVNFKKRKQYDSQPLIPSEVYETEKEEAAVFLDGKESVPTRGPTPSEMSRVNEGAVVVEVPDHRSKNEPVTDINRMKDTPVLIYPRRIDNLYRFRVLYAGLCMFIVSSLQGLHALFGLLLLDQTYHLSLTENINIYTCGAAFGMFVLPFGILYDYFGPRPTIAIGTAMMILSEIFLALCFRETIRPTYARIAVLYGLMSWGCYTLDVAVLPCVLTHMPRDKGQPTGLLKTFSGLGASFISCLYRGFFNRSSYPLEDNFAALFFFCLTLTVLVGFVCIWYLHDAPYVVTRWERFRARQVAKRKINKEKKEYTEAEVEKHEKDFNDLLKLRLKKYLIRNRYMAQLMPKRRYGFVTIILILLNFFLTIQAICAAWFASNMTPGKYRGLAIGAIIIVASLAVLVIPIRAIDEPSPQDEEIVRKAKEKEEKLKNVKEAQAKKEYLEEKKKKKYRSASEGGRTPQKSRNSSFNSTHHIHRQAELVEVDFDDDAPLRASREPRQGDPTGNSVHSGSLRPGDREVSDVLLNHSISFSASVRYNTRQPVTSSPGQHPLADDGPASAPATAPASPTKGKALNVVTVPYSTYDHPFIETINVCGEVFVAPVYQTSFFKSLTYIDIYLLFYTTFVLWGVGLTTTANYNIYIMLMARDGNMDYKMYILFSAMSGVFVAGGRVFIGVWERVTMVLKQKKNIYVTATATYPLCSILMLIGTVLWAALPGKYILVMAYLFVSAAYGASTSITPYVITSIFERDVGTHYGFCFLGAAIGMVIFHRLSFYQLYLQHAVPMPPMLPFVGDRCIGQRKCLNNTMIVYNIFVASTLISSIWLHSRYKQLVTGKVAAPQRVITPIFRAIFCCGKSSEKSSSDEDDDMEKKSRSCEPIEEDDNESNKRSREPYHDDVKGEESSVATEVVSEIVVDPGRK